MVLNVAAKLLKSEGLDENMKVTEPINIIYQTAEDGLADTVKPRLELAGADCEKIILIDESDKSLSMIDRMLCKDIELACDEKVIKDMRFEDKKEYSRGLLSCATQRHLGLQ